MNDGNCRLMALPKGRLATEVLDLFKGTAFEPRWGERSDRTLRVPTQCPELDLILLKGADISRYVVPGIAVFGILGSDLLDEESSDVLEVADLKRGNCRLCLCALEGTRLEDLRQRPHLRLATKFPRATTQWLKKEGLTAELVPLQSSVELAPLLGLADAIVDLVQSGSTLKAHGLVPLCLLKHCSARLIVSRGFYYAQPQEASSLVKSIWDILAA